MSRWLNTFENHVFNTPWNAIKGQLLEIEVADKTITTDVQELARLKKAFTYVDGIISGCDPELIPAATWDNFATQTEQCLSQITSYSQNKNIAHLTSANLNMDNLLTYIRPYMLVEGKIGRTMQASLREYNKTIGGVIESFKTSAKTTLDEIKSLNKSSQEAEQKTLEIKNRLDALNTNYFDGNEEEDALTEKVDRLVSDSETLYKKITVLHTKLFDGDDENKAINNIIEEAKTSSVESSNSIRSLLNENLENVSELSKFYKEIFGNEDEAGEIVGGLKNELNERQEQLNIFETTQQEKHDALFRGIEGLLPGATSAGLATAYYDLKESFKWPIIIYSWLFYLFVLVLFALGISLVTQSIPLMTIETLSADNITNFGFKLFQKLMIFVPIIWLAVFASKRRSEAKRLQQEYAHKEAMAKSYQGFKKQISELQDKDDKLINQLISSVLDAVSFNASTTLDGKHGDKSPVHDLVEKSLSPLKSPGGGSKVP